MSILWRWTANTRPGTHLITSTGRYLRINNLGNKDAGARPNEPHTFVEPNKAGKVNIVAGSKDGAEIPIKILLDKKSAPDFYFWINAISANMPIVLTDGIFARIRDI